ncbi:MAG TPA: PqqD family protein [Polyangia bacterium]|jgi:hypothetical protein
MARRTAPARNLLDLAPTREVGAERTAEGRVVLLRPRFKSGPLARWVQPRLRRPYYRIHLDDIGTFVWDHIDGATTVGAIADGARAEFGERIEPVYERLHLFLQQLEQGKMIKIPR